MSADRSMLTGKGGATMRRLQLLEIEDQPWCPPAIRDALTDYLQFVIDKARPYSTLAPQLRAFMSRAGVSEVTDLCSGGGGPWRSLAGELGDCRIRLTDLYPNVRALTELR